MVIFDLGAFRKFTVCGLSVVMMVFCHDAAAVVSPSCDVTDDTVRDVPLSVDLSLEGGYGSRNFVNAALCLGYDLGRGWSVCAEGEINHACGGHAAVYEYDGSERFAAPPESGTEVCVDQIWIQKTFSGAANIRVGRVFVPVGLGNAYNATLDYFSVYGREGEGSILPGVWYDMGVSFWGRAGDFGYEAQLVSGLDALMFGNGGWVSGGTVASAFKTDRKFGCAARVENFSLPGLRLGASGYAGHVRYILGDGEKLASCVFIGAFDFTYDHYNLLVRGQADYGYVSGTREMNRVKADLAETDGADASPVGKNAFAMSVEAGYDILSAISSMNGRGRKLYLFGRYENYDPFASSALNRPSVGGGKSASCNRHELLAFGVNYHPMGALALKVEMTKRLKNTPYADEPSVSVGFAYEGSLF